VLSGFPGFPGFPAFQLSSFFSGFLFPGLSRRLSSSSLLGLPQLVLDFGPGYVYI